MDWATDQETYLGFLGTSNGQETLGDRSPALALQGATKHNVKDRLNTLLLGGMHYEQVQTGQVLIMANHASSYHPL